MRITVSGTIGSGKSTVAKMLAEKTGYAYISGGDMFRKTASLAGMSVEEFNLYAEKHPEIDREQDKVILETLKSEEKIIFDSRLSGWIAYRNDLVAFRIYITAEMEERIARVVRREGGSPDSVRSRIMERETSEKKRYMEFYDIDVDSTDIYDLVIHSDDLKPEEVTDIILEQFHGRDE